MTVGEWPAIIAISLTVAGSFLKIFSDYSKMQNEQKNIKDRCNESNEKIDCLERHTSERIAALHEKINTKADPREITEIKTDVAETKRMVVQLYDTLLKKGGA